MMRASAPKSTSIATDKYKIALDSGATTHVMNASSLDGSVEVMHVPSTIRTAHLGDTMTSNLSANIVTKCTNIIHPILVMDI